MKIIKTKEDVPKAMRDIGKTFKVLSERERRILVLRYGLESGEPKTLGEVGKKFHVTRERIRQIETKAFEKIELVLKYEE